MSEDEDLFDEFRTFVFEQVLHVCASRHDENVELKQFDKNSLNELKRQFDRIPTNVSKAPIKHAIVNESTNTLTINYKFPSYTYHYTSLGFYINDNNLLRPDNTITYDKKLVYCCELLDQLAELENPERPNQTILDYDFSKDDFDDYMYYREQEFGVDVDLIKKWENTFRFDYFIKAIKPPLFDLNYCRLFRPETIKLYDQIKRDFGDIRNIIFNMLTLLDYKTLH